MIKTKCIDEFKIGQNIYGFYQSIFKEKKISKNGDYYIDLFLKDKTGKINGKIWNFIDFYDSAFKEGDLVVVKGEIKKYRKTLYLEVNHISLLDSARYSNYVFDNTNLCPTIDSSHNIIFNKITKEIKKLNNPFKKLLLNIYNHYEDKIKNYPDDLLLSDYDKKGSLILKIYRSVAIAKSFQKFYSKDDIDLILSALLLKYIGRVKQYQYDLIFSFSDIGSSEDCIILSRDIIKDFSNKINIPKKNINELIDIIMYDYISKSREEKNNKGSLVSIIYDLEKTLFLNDLEK